MARAILCFLFFLTVAGLFNINITSLRLQTLTAPNIEFQTKRNSDNKAATAVISRFEQEVGALKRAQQIDHTQTQELLVQLNNYAQKNEKGQRFNDNGKSKGAAEEASRNKNADLTIELEQVKAQVAYLKKGNTLLQETLNTYNDNTTPITVSTNANTADTNTSAGAVVGKTEQAGKKNGTAVANFYSSRSSVCSRMESVLDLRTWAPVRYHKNRTGEITTKYDKNYIDSVKEDDEAARSTIAEFNRIQKSDNPVLTKPLLDAGFTTGGDYPALKFAERVATSSSSSKHLQVAVFGNSFAIGSNCGESTQDSVGDCAWPNRLARRWAELFSGGEEKENANGLPAVAVDWHMWQENAQGSLNIAQKLPALMESFRSKNVTPDAILLDNSITDLNLEAWFEAVVRALLQTYPGVVIVSIVDASPNLVTFSEKRKHLREYYQYLRGVQIHYDLTVVDLAEMVRVQHNESSSNNNDTHIQQDRIWPQATYMVSASGEQKNDKEAKGEVYWSNFVPKVRKTKTANYPANHPAWPTHQYVADTVAYALLRTISKGCSLMGNIQQQDQYVASRLLPKDTVATKEKIDACPICLNPLSRIDSKAPPLPPSPDINRSSIVSVISGDWKWVIDDRNRTGWQSDEAGSLIRFRLRIGAETPQISLTHMASYSTFGNFRVTFRTLDKAPLLTWSDISNNNTSILPSLLVKGGLPQYSLSKTVVFPAKGDLITGKAWNLLNATVLSQKPKKKPNSTAADYDEVDLYVENIGTHDRTRVKIQMITVC